MTRLGDDTVHAFKHGRKSEIGESAVPLVGAPTAVTRGVQLKAAADNMAEVYVGNSNVTIDVADATDGFPLAAGEGLFVAVDDASKIYLCASSEDQQVFYLLL